MSAIKLAVYLGGHSLDYAREQARRLSEIDQCPMFVNIRAHRRPDTNEFIVAFVVSIRAGEDVEAIFVNGREQTL